jgi:hypothetical protein
MKHLLHASPATAPQASTPQAGTVVYVRAELRGNWVAFEANETDACRP